MPVNILELHNVFFSYSKEKSILENININIHKKDLIIIHGESGAGKSTFLKLFNRFCDSYEGQILFHHKNIKEYRIENIRSSIIYLPQLPYIIDGTVEENLLFPYTFHAHSNQKFMPEKAESWFDYFQLNIPLSHDALKLSIGQRQRVALIRSLLLRPEILLLDEPGSALDKNNKRLIEQKLEELIESSDITVIMATHSEVDFQKTNYRAFHLKDRKLNKM